MKLPAFLLLTGGVLFGLACSGKSVLTVPDSQSTSQVPQSVADSHHQLLGLWQCKADPSANKIDIVPVRTGQWHLNALKYLEPPVGVKLKISNLSFTGSTCDVDVTLVHPLQGQGKMMGFDVAGILISDGTVGGFSDPAIVMAGPEETRLINSDGLTRWYNPVEFLTWGYIDGLMGTKNEIAHFKSTINGYKLFSNAIGLNDDISSVPPTSRMPFYSGTQNSRHYKIDFSGGMVFNYAVDANWYHGGLPPFTEDSFPEEANRAEPWGTIVTELKNTLYNDGLASGGKLTLRIELRDHYHIDEDKLWIESPGNLQPVAVPYPISGGVGYNIYEVDIYPTPPEGKMDIVVRAECEETNYGDALVGARSTSYFLHIADVASTISKTPTAFMKATSPTEIAAGQDVSFDASASTGDSPLTFSWDFNADGVYDGSGDSYSGSAVNPTHTFPSNGPWKVTLKVDNDSGSDISAPVIVHVGMNPDDTYVDGDYPGADSDGSIARPFTRVQDGMKAVTAGHTLHVDYMDTGTGKYETGYMYAVSDVTMIGDNWNAGGPGKPRLDSDVHYFALTCPCANFTLEGFEVGIGAQPGYAGHGGIELSGDNITIRHCKFTDYVIEKANMGYCNVTVLKLDNFTNSLVEYNEFGPLTIENMSSDTGYSSSTTVILMSECNDSVIKNNYIHDISIVHPGNGYNGGSTTIFSIGEESGIDVHNNLVCHITDSSEYAINLYGAAFHIGYSINHKYSFYNNTFDKLVLDNQGSYWGNTIGFTYAWDSDPHYWPMLTDSYVDNALITNLQASNPISGITAFFGIAEYNQGSDTWDRASIRYCTGYNLPGLTDYFVPDDGWELGDGLVDAPGVDPQYVNSTVAPYDYHFKPGSLCEYGDPNFLDWDDSGTPSGNPNDPDIQNRSRMGCFGGPDGDWDPNNL
jgi:hypothetical protein